MTTEEAVAKLEALDESDAEVSHIEADNVLLAMVPEEVRAAYMHATEKIGFWYA